MVNNKKSDERMCLDKTRAYLSGSINSETREVINIITGDVIESERPDFIILNNKNYIGVEHFLVDTMLGRRKASRTKTRKSEINRTYQKYHDKITGNEEQALQDIASTIQSDVDAMQYFDYKKYIEEFNRITIEHYNKIDNYRNLNKKISKFVFLIEIPISINRIIGTKCIYANNSLEDEEVKGRNFPITIHMLNTLRKISDKVDYTIISVMHENYKSVPYVVYALDNKRIIESLFDQQKETYFSFTYRLQTNSNKAEVKLELKDRSF